MSIMLDAKNARKRAETDIQLLANRLQHLRVAEERAREKICETKVGRPVGAAEAPSRLVSSRLGAGAGTETGARQSRDIGVPAISARTTRAHPRASRARKHHALLALHCDSSLFARFRAPAPF